MKAILRNRALLTIGLSESVSGIGNWITLMAVFALLIFERGGGVATSSGLFLAALGPMLIASPVAGWLCDRYDRRRLMIVSELLSGAIVAGLMFASAPWLIYTLVALEACSTAIMLPARQAVVPDLVAEEELPQANALFQQLASIIKIGAPILAGALLLVLEPHQAMLLDVVSFGLSALILSRLPALPPHHAPREATAQDGRPAEQTLLGTLRATPRLVLLFALVFVVTSLIMGVDVLSSLVVRDLLAGNEAFYGLTIGLIGVGSVVAALVIMLRKQQPDPWHDIIVSLPLLSAIPFALMLAGWMGGHLAGQIVVGAGALLAGAGTGLAMVQVGTLLQRLSPTALLGQIGGAFQGVSVAGQLLTLVALPLTVPALIPLPTYFAGMGVGILLAALATLALLAATRERAANAPAALVK